jgi:DNA polymerase I-like protein with 3'-5' exonuclease and polymerase domains/uracil-DNA glycosylase
MAKYLMVQDSPPSEGYLGWLVKELSKLGIQSADCEWLNLIEEYPEGAHGKVTVRQIRENAPRFYEALRASDARAIVTFGPEAMRAVLGLDLGIDQARGYVFDANDVGMTHWREEQVIGEYKTSNPKKGYKKGDPRRGMVTVERPAYLPAGARVIPSYSVAYIITKRKKPFYAFAQDIRRAKAAAEGTLVMQDAEFNEGRTFSTRPVVGWEPIGDRFAFDIETPKDSRDVRAYAGISFSDGVTSMSLDWNEETREYARLYLGNPKYKKYAHNAMFDVSRLRDAGCPVAGTVFDTMLGGQLLQPDLLKRLESMAPLYLNIKPWKRLYEEDPYFYSAKDSFLELLLADQIELRLEQTGMMPLANTIMDALPTLLSMNEEGLRVDVTRAARWADGLKEKLVELMSQWFAAVGENVSPTSTQQVHKYFYHTLGLEPAKGKQDGNSLDAEALYDLKKLYPQHAPVIIILEGIREVGKQYGTYAKTLAGMLSQTEDRVHPQYLPGGQEGETYGRKGGASTGRLGVSNPNIQNQTPEARMVYVPDTAGHAFVELDYSQAELRIIAALAHDERLRAALSASDFHQVTADRLGIPRPVAKNTIYASCYLGGPGTIQSMLKRNGHLVEISEIKKAQALMKREYTRMFAWQQATVAEGTAQGFLRNPFGRVRFFYGRRDDGPEMADYNPQSCVADITWRILRAMDLAARKYGGRLSTQVHDSFLMMVLAQYLEEATAEFKRIMEQPWPEIAPGFYIPVSVKVGAPGQSWGELEKAA